MKTETIVMCIVALILGMLLANMLKSVCGCKNVEGQSAKPIADIACDSTDAMGAIWMEAMTEKCPNEFNDLSEDGAIALCSIITKNETWNSLDGKQSRQDYPKLNDLIECMEWDLDIPAQNPPTGETVDQPTNS